MLAKKCSVNFCAIYPEHILCHYGHLFVFLQVCLAFFQHSFVLFSVWMLLVGHQLLRLFHFFMRESFNLYTNTQEKKMCKSNRDE